MSKAYELIALVAISAILALAAGQVAVGAIQPMSELEVCTEGCRYSNVQAAIEIVDTPGLSRTHEGNATRLAAIREAGCLAGLALTMLCLAARTTDDAVWPGKAYQRVKDAGNMTDLGPLWSEK